MASQTPQTPSLDFSQIVLDFWRFIAKLWAYYASINREARGRQKMCGGEGGSHPPDPNSTCVHEDVEIILAAVQNETQFRLPLFGMI